RERRHAYRPAEARLHEPARPQVPLVSRGAARKGGPSFECRAWRVAYPCRFTRNDTSRRVEMPASTGSPGFDARTNMTSRCWRGVAGKPRSVRNCSETSPELSVCCCDGIEIMLYG